MMLPTDEGTTVHHPADSTIKLIAAPFTPFHDDGSLDLDAVPRQVERLRADGVSGAFVCGTTGEGASLTLAERRQVAQRWRDLAGEELAIIVHVGATSAYDARSLAEHAASIGANAIAAVGPYYHRPGSVADLVAFCGFVAAGAPDVPFLYYHIPSMTGLAFAMAEFIELARERIPSFGGIKFTHGDLAEFGRCLELAGDRLAVHYGRDQHLLGGLALGASSAVGSTYNFAAPLYLRMAAAFAAGDLGAARKAQGIARAMIDVAGRYGGLSAMKAISDLLGVPCGPTRMPLSYPGPTDRQRLAEDLRQVGFLDALPAPASA